MFDRPGRLIAALSWAALASAQTNPFDNSQSMEQGSALFQLHCAVCHGARGQGGRGADLTTGQYRRGGSDAELYSTIRDGIRGTEMPAVKVSGDDAWKLVAFVRKLGAAGLGEKAPGSAAAGKSIFEGKGRCLTCHSIGRNGGSLGPDLAGVGRRRDLRYLLESLVSPEADVPIRYRAVRLVTKSGAAVTGIRLNEDDVSIQVRDTGDGLRSFFKSDLKEIRRDQPSSMPSFASMLSRQELEDVVAFLSSLRSSE